VKNEGKGRIIVTEHDVTSGLLQAEQMRIKNEMEIAVRAAINRQKEGSGSSGSSAARKTFALVMSLIAKDKKRLSCGCALCSADAAALSLISLPSCYCRSHHYGIALESIKEEDIEARVREAVRRVTLHPKHPSHQPIPDSSKIVLVDLGLKEGARMVGSLLNRMPDACDCQYCREDALALALNSTSPKYCVRIQNRFRFPPHHLEFFRHEFMPLLSEAVKKVVLNPRHGDTAGEQTCG
jgi:hypothetical protein